MDVSRVGKKWWPPLQSQIELRSVCVFFKGLFLRIFFAVAIQKVLIKPSEELALSVFTPEVQRL